MASNPFSQNRLTFVAQVAGNTNLDPGVILAWTASEFDPSFVQANINGNQDWMAIGGAGARTGASDPAWRDPATAGQSTAAWLHGRSDPSGVTAPSFGTASPGIQAILTAAGKSPQAQIAAVNNSGWVSGTPGPGGGYGATLPDNYATYHRFAPGAAAAGPGGVAGLGGSGTTADGSSASTYKFVIGTSANPDEDFWTGVNRLAQEVNWYLFSNGENMYYMDGAELIAQTPALYLDRIGDADRLVTLRGTYDNTAYEYVSDHKRRFHVQRKTKLTTITSPTEVTLDLICGIDEIRGGDVIVLSSFGTMDGAWIVGDCTRSVFSVTSSITLVPPIAPLSEVAAVGTTGTSKNTTIVTNGATSGGPTLTGGYANPFPNGWVPGRLDCGYDGTFTNQIVAPFDCTVGPYAETSFSNWGGWLVIVADGSLPGLPSNVFYFAEGIKPTVSTGQKVQAGQQIAIAFTTGAQAGIAGNIEWGLADPNNPGNPLARPLGNGAAATQMVFGFSAWVQKNLKMAPPATTDHAGRF